jgi:LVIVD repeat
MKRLIVAISVGTLGLLAAPTAQGAGTPLNVQDNVRHVVNVPGTTGGHVVVQGDRLYMGNYGTGVSAYDISNPASPVKIGQYLPGPSTAGGTDQGVRADAPPDAAFWDGRHIVSLGGTTRDANRVQTEFLDFTNPASPQLLWRFTAAGDAESHNGDIVDARRLWMPSGEGGTNFVRIYDMNPLLQTPPAAPDDIFRGNINTMWVQSPYRTALNKSTGVLTDHIHDLEVYTDYNLLMLPSEWVDQDGDGDTDPTYKKRDIALYAATQGYPIAANAGAPANSAVYILDITDPTAPVVINKIRVRDGHRYLHEAQFLQGNDNVLFTADENFNDGCDGKIYSWTLSDDLTTATFKDDWSNGLGTPAGVCSPHVFSSDGQFVMMGSYQAGLQVIDFSDPANLTRAGQYIAEGANSWGALAAKGHVYVGDFGGRGLDVFQFIPRPDTKGIVKVNNPSVTNVASPGGVTEVLGECDPASPANGIDGLIVPIPADKRDGTHFLRSVGGAGSNAPYDLNVYWYDASCAFMSGVSHNSTSPDEYGLIPEGASAGVIDLVTGPPMWVYAQIDPQPGFGFTPPASTLSSTGR